MVIAVSSLLNNFVSNGNKFNVEKNAKIVWLRNVDPSLITFIIADINRFQFLKFT
ncbi:hypothetical protein SPPR111872_25890 [Sphingobacterium prati]